MAPKRILLVDDSETVLMMNKLILSKEGYAILVAKDGQQALDVAFSDRPDLILMDVVMPHVNGFEALRALRGRDETKDIPVIMVTTRGESENIRCGFEVGATAYVTKPINAVELLTKIRACFEACAAGWSSDS
jgi:DNA-binding response OmpR family regulator